MIIFDLDGTLADCEHRRHFVTKPTNCKFVYTDVTPRKNGCILNGEYRDANGLKWNPDWKAFYEACDQDKPIESSLKIIRMFISNNYPVQIWSGRCESVRDKTIKWLSYNITQTITWGNGKWEQFLKMRPIGDYTPDDELKERWLDEALAEGKKIDFVFDDRPKVIRLWKRRGIFVFDVNQNGEEF